MYYKSNYIWSNTYHINSTSRKMLRKRNKMDYKIAIIKIITSMSFSLKVVGLVKVKTKMDQLYSIAFGWLVFTHDVLFLWLHIYMGEPEIHICDNLDFRADVLNW